MKMRFDISLDEARAGMHPELSKIIYHNVLAGWRHESGAWLTIEKVPNLPHYFVAWRATPFWGNRYISYDYGFIENNPLLAWPRALKQAESLFEVGPSGQVMDRAAETFSNYSERGEKAGKKSGQVRSAKAQQNAEEIAEAKELCLKFVRSEHLPKYKPELWHYEVHTDMSEINFALAFKPISGTCVYAEMNMQTSLLYVERDYYPNGNNDLPRIEERVASDVPYERALEIVAKLAATNPAEWNKGDLKRFVER